MTNAYKAIMSSFRQQVVIVWLDFLFGKCFIFFYNHIQNIIIIDFQSSMRDIGLVPTRFCFSPLSFHCIQCIIQLIMIINTHGHNKTHKHTHIHTNIDNDHIFMN